MKTTTYRLLGYWIFLMSLTVSFQAFPQNVLQLTLQESLTYALENSADAKNAQLETLIAKAQIIERRSEGLPQISASYDITHNVAIPRVFVPNEGGFFNLMSTQMFCHYNLGLTIVLLLLYSHTNDF
jgi:outer membrane protein